MYHRYQIIFFSMFTYNADVTLVKDHGRVDCLDCWDGFVQKARFKKLVCLHHIKQNNLAYLGRVCKHCLSMSTGIYALVYKNTLVIFFHHLLCNMKFENS